jgi:hypothetical protein
MHFYSLVPIVATAASALVTPLEGRGVGNLAARQFARVECESSSFVGIPMAAPVVTAICIAYVACVGDDPNPAPIVAIPGVPTVGIFDCVKLCKCVGAGTGTGARV